MFEEIDINYNEKQLALVFLVETSREANCLIYDPIISKISYEKEIINSFNSRQKRDLSVITQQGVLELACRLRDQFNITLGENLFADTAADFSATEEQIRAIIKDISAKPRDYYHSENKRNFGL
jgi:hypothetical protein